MLFSFTEHLNPPSTVYICHGVPLTVRTFSNATSLLDLEPRHALNTVTWWRSCAPHTTPIAFFAHCCSRSVGCTFNAQVMKPKPIFVHEIILVANIVTLETRSQIFVLRLDPLTTPSRIKLLSTCWCTSAILYYKLRLSAG